MATADTGCSVKLLALRCRRKQTNTHNVRTAPATGVDMTVNGQASITVSSGTQLMQLNILISSDLDEDMLLGLKCLKDMDRIPQGFRNYRVQGQICRLGLSVYNFCVTESRAQLILLKEAKKFKL